MELRVRNAFLALILVQAAHSLEEYVFGLYEVFVPARLASSLVSGDPAVGFAILNLAIVAFGAWCYLFHVRSGTASGRTWVWPWVVVSVGNGLVHTTVAAVRGTYFPGVVTAPFLFMVAAYIAIALLRDGTVSRRAAA